jgi:hypothetical protein
MSAATIFDGGRPNSRRRPFADLFAGGESDDASAATHAPTAGPGEPPCLSAYLQGLERAIERAQRTQIRETLVEVSPREVQRVVEKAAKAKARYLALVLEMAEHDGLPEAKQIETLESARTRHEAMQAGVDALTAALRAGHVRVTGVVPDDWPAADPR